MSANSDDRATRQDNEHQSDAHAAASTSSDPANQPHAISTQRRTIGKPSAHRKVQHQPVPRQPQRKEDTGDCQTPRQMKPALQRRPQDRPDRPAKGRTTGSTGSRATARHRPATSTCPNFTRRVSNRAGTPNIDGPRPDRQTPPTYSVWR